MRARSAATSTANSPARGAPDRLEPLNFFRGGDRGGVIIFKEEFVLLRQQGTQHQHGPAGAEFPDGGRLGHIGNGEKIGAGMHEARDGLMQAVPVRVGFHNGDVFDVGRQRSANEPEISFKRRQVDFGPAAEGKLRSRGHG